eukprot:CAMPEP_0119431636 /NCGR_PEP_ID=MMETSP1335-20130426/46292_1 /TAXON_ID=259385 /ORGANISM="Chrysoculter rhomboideus, Strain RCC1486" /LENGTH=85 /DNA_ID=CAMNT_0007457443 /DNA_START=288 /DNA_END=545 /DNA_ORIENTATION=+
MTARRELERPSVEMERVAIPLNRSSAQRIGFFSCDRRECTVVVPLGRNVRGREAVGGHHVQHVSTTFALRMQQAEWTLTHLVKVA